MADDEASKARKVAEILGLGGDEVLELMRMARERFGLPAAGEGAGPLLLNPAQSGPAVPAVPAAVGEARPVPFVDEPFVLDPETLKVWRMGEGDAVPATDGVRVNFPFFNMDKPPSVCLAVTRACNLRCRYCFVQNRSDMDGGHMDSATAAKAFKLCNTEGLSISFFGGEPLLRFSTLRNMVAEAKSVCTDPKFHITTNGVLLDDEMGEFFQLNGFSFIVSMDGPPDVHNMNRPLAGPNGDGATSYDRTLAGLAVLKRHGMASRVTLRSTYTKDCARLTDRLAHLNDLCDQGLGGSVAVEPVSSSESNCVDPQVGSALGFQVGDALRLRSEYEAACAWALERLRSGRRARWHHLSHFAGRILGRRPAPTECGAGKGYMGVAPDGRLFACHREPGGPIGHVDWGFDEGARACWLENRLCGRRTCPECWARHVCGGGCRADSVVHMGDVREPYTTGCTIYQIAIAQTIRLIDQLTDSERQLLMGGPAQ